MTGTTPHRRDGPTPQSPDQPWKYQPGAGLPAWMTSSVVLIGTLTTRSVQPAAQIVPFTMKLPSPALTMVTVTVPPPSSGGPASAVCASAARASAARASAPGASNGPAASAVTSGASAAPGALHRPATQVRPA